MVAQKRHSAIRQPGNRMRRPPPTAAHNANWDRPENCSRSNKSAAAELLQIEDDARKSKNQAELEFLAANVTRKLLRTNQVFVFVASGTMKLKAVSGLPSVDRNSPFVQDIEALLSAEERRRGLEEKHSFTWNDAVEQPGNSRTARPYHALHWVPFRIGNEKSTGGLLLARQDSWSSSDEAIVQRLADIFGHNLALLQFSKRRSPRLLTRILNSRKTIIGAVIALLLGLALPVPMATLSPFEIVPQNASVTAAPIEGVIEDVYVHPGEFVQEGQPLLQFADTKLRNRYEIAQREVLVAGARLKKASQLAFDDIQGRHELRLAMADKALKAAQRDFAYEMLHRTRVTAKSSGIALFADRKSLVGKPVSLGERILRIANPKQVEVAIDVAIADTISLQKDAQVTLYFASDPLATRDAKVAFIDYRARKRDGEAHAHRVIAKLTEQGETPPKLGMRGTAKIYSSHVPLALFLFRRPVAAARQWLGL